MSGSALFHVAFIAVAVMILLTVWGAMVLEAGQHPPGRGDGTAKAGDEPAGPNAP
jgi:hypothetical protein